MSTSDFRKMYEQEWDLSRAAKLHDFAKEYHDRCEAYDRTVCTGPIGQDGIMPATHEEHGKISRNAQEVLRDVLKRATQEGLSREEVTTAISRFRL